MKILVLSILLLPAFSWAANSLPIEVDLNCDASYTTQTDRPASRRYHHERFTFKSSTETGVRGEIKFAGDHQDIHTAKGKFLVMPDDWGVNSDGSPFMGKVVLDGKIIDPGLKYGSTFKVVLRGRELLELLDGSKEELIIKPEEESQLWKYLGHGYVETAVIYDGHSSRWDTKNIKYYTRQLGGCYGSVKKIRSRR